MHTANADTLVVYFRNRLPVMLDGALRRADDRGVLLRRARLSLGKNASAAGRAGLLPAEILRETLDAVAAHSDPDSGSVPKTLAGAVPVSPHHARVWWDKRVLDNLDDVLARLDDPRPVLRFYDVTGLDPDAGRWHAVFDLDVELSEAGKTVHFWSADRSYVVDLGYIHADGRFLRLARTNAVDLPRDGAGVIGSGGTAFSRIAPAGDASAAAYVLPDAAAREWFDRRSGSDSANRDRDAELVVHMLYRAFLLEGPRALRRVPALVRRGADILRSEYADRQRSRRSGAAAVSARDASASSAFLVRRLDAVSVVSAPVGTSPVSIVVPVPAVDIGKFVWHQGLLRAARGGVFVRGAVAAGTKALPIASASDGAARRAVHIRVAGAEMPAALFAVSVFEAARNLRESLAGLRDIGAGTVPGRSSVKDVGRFVPHVRRPLHA